MEHCSLADYVFAVSICDMEYEYTIRDKTTFEFCKLKFDNAFCGISGLEIFFYCIVGLSNGEECGDIKDSFMCSEGE